MTKVYLPQDRTFAVFGTGTLGNKVVEYLKQKKCKISCLFDNDKKKWNKLCSGFKVLPPS